MGFRGITMNTQEWEGAHIKPSDDAALYAAIMGGGGDCVFDHGSRFAAEQISNTTVRIGSGLLMVGGHYGLIEHGDYQDMWLDSGTSGMKRNDLIVARFTTFGYGSEDFSLEVIKGAPATEPTDPGYNHDDLAIGGVVRDLPLFRVRIDSINIEAIEPMFDTFMGMVEDYDFSGKEVPTNQFVNGKRLYRYSKQIVTPKPEAGQSVLLFTLPSDLEPFLPHFVDTSRSTHKALAWSSEAIPYYKSSDTFIRISLGGITGREVWLHRGSAVQNSMGNLFITVLYAKREVN